MESVLEHSGFIENISVYFASVFDIVDVSFDLRSSEYVSMNLIPSEREDVNGKKNLAHSKPVSICPFFNSLGL